MRAALLLLLVSLAACGSPGSVELRVTNATGRDLYRAARTTSCGPGWIIVGIPDMLAGATGIPLCGDDLHGEQCLPTTAPFKQGETATHLWDGHVFVKSGDGADACLERQAADRGEYTASFCAGETLEGAIPAGTQPGPPIHCDDVRFTLNSEDATVLAELALTP
jgi:hypothetical protein